MVSPPTKQKTAPSNCQRPLKLVHHLGRGRHGRPRHVGRVAVGQRPVSVGGDRCGCGGGGGGVGGDGQHRLGTRRAFSPAPPTRLHAPLATPASVAATIVAGVAADRFWLPSNGRTAVLAAINASPTAPPALGALVAVLGAPLLALLAVAVRAHVEAGTKHALCGAAAAGGGHKKRVE